MKFININKRGISLIVLVITIIIMIILAGAILLNLAEDNPIDDANETKFKADITAYRDELGVYISDKQIEAARSGQTYYPEDDAELANLQGVAIVDKISGFKDIYYDKLEIRTGVLTYIGTSVDEKSWAKELGIGIVE